MTAGIIDAARSENRQLLSEWETYRILSERGDLLYFADNYADELPFWADVAGKPELFVPYTLDANDMRFATSNGFADAVEFYRYLRDSFDMLYQDGLDGRPRMMSVGLHGRLSGRPEYRFADHDMRPFGSPLRAPRLLGPVTSPDAAALIDAAGSAGFLAEIEHRAPSTSGTCAPSICRR